MQTKAISAVIATIMLLMISVSLISVFYVFSSTLLTTSSSSGSEQASQLTKQLSTCVRIDSMLRNQITLTNCGTGVITNDSLAVFIDDAKLKISMNTVSENSQVDVNITNLPNTTQKNHVLQIKNGIGSDTQIYSSIPRKGTESNPGISCADIFASGFLPSSGVYWISSGSSKFQAYCDMTMDEGGWTLAAVCKASNPTCWNANSVGSILNPNITSSGKLSDSNIKSILIKGENITRTYWNQTNRSGVVNPVSAVIFNRIANPNIWTSASCGATNDLKEFYVKYEYASSWGSAIYTNTTTCACSSNGWSNTQKDSCGFATWYAGCESGHSMKHSCADPVERADIVVWIR